MKKLSILSIPLLLLAIFVSNPVSAITASLEIPLDSSLLFPGTQPSTIPNTSQPQTEIPPEQWVTGGEETVTDPTPMPPPEKPKSEQYSNIAEIIDLGNLRPEAPDAQEPIDINNRGEIIGNAMPTGGHAYHAFLWKNGNIKDLGTLGGDVSEAMAINDLGQIVGLSTINPRKDEGFDDEGPSHIFLWKNGKMKDLEAFSTLGVGTYPTDINNKGQIVGWQYISDRNAKSRAFLLKNGKMKHLKGLGGRENLANAINNKGQIVGCSMDKNRMKHAVLWKNGAMKDLGSLDGMDSCATDINDRGQIIGWSQIVNGEQIIQEAFLWENGIMKKPEGLPAGSYLKKINNKGQIIGSAESKTFLWQNGKTFVTDHQEWLLSNIVAINDAGIIAGNGHKSNSYGSYALRITLKPASEMKQNKEEKMEEKSLPEFSKEEISSSAVKIQRFLKVDLPREFRNLPITTYAINNKGTVAMGPLVWKDGKFTKIPELAEGQDVFAKSINDKDQIVGFAYSDPEDDTTAHAFLYENGEIKDIGALFGKQQSSEAVDINNKGQIIGRYTDSRGDWHPFILESGKIKNLGTLGRKFVAYDVSDINESGQIVGTATYDTDHRASHAFLWENGEMKDLGASIEEDTGAIAINDKGQILGYVKTPMPGGPDYSFVNEAMIWENGTTKRLGIDGPTDINNKGQIVGQAFIKNTGPFLWQDGTFVGLNDLLSAETRLNYSYDFKINDMGQILGSESLFSLPPNIPFEF